jgi:hypothetical protein
MGGAAGETCVARKIRETLVVDERDSSNVNISLDGDTQLDYD